MSQCEPNKVRLEEHSKYGEQRSKGRKWASELSIQKVVDEYPSMARLLLFFVCLVWLVCLFVLCVCVNEFGMTG